MTTRTKSKQATSKAPSRSRQGHGQDEHIALRVWLRLLACSSRIESALDQRMRTQFNISLARFDLLAQLGRSSAGLTMTQASQGMKVSNGAITNLVDRLVKEGFVSRETLEEDRRTTVIRLTDLGRREFTKIAATHEQWVIEMIGGLGEDNLMSLKTQLTALRTLLDEAE